MQNGTFGKVLTSQAKYRARSEKYRTSSKTERDELSIPQRPIEYVMVEGVVLLDFQTTYYAIATVLDMQAFFVPLAALLGLILGSFYNVCIYRYQTGESVVFPSSHCPVCGKRLRVWELIPIASYLILKGRCSACHTPISTRYPLIEGVSGLLATLLALRYGAGIPFLVYLAFIGALLVASAIDWDTFVLPDGMTLGGSFLAIPSAVCLLGETWQNSVLGALLGAGGLAAIHFYYRKVRHIEGLGLGDVKLMFMLGGLCGLTSLPVVLFVGSATGIALTLILRGRQAWDVPVPFGPFLSLGAFVWIVFF